MKLSSSARARNPALAVGVLAFGARFASSLHFAAVPSTY